MEEKIPLYQTLRKEKENHLNKTISFDLLPMTYELFYCYIVKEKWNALSNAVEDFQVTLQITQEVVDKQLELE